MGIDSEEGVPINGDLLIDSLKKRIANDAVEIASRDAVIATLSQKFSEQAQQIAELQGMVDAISSELVAQVEKPVELDLDMSTNGHKETADHG